MKKYLIVFVSFLSIACIHRMVAAQQQFRSGIFLHHSTGGCIWGPNGSNTSVPAEMNDYNLAHGYTAQHAVTMNEEWWSPSDNEWATQHTFFEDPSPVTGIGYYLPGNKIIVVKTCFPASAMVGVGQPSDTLTPYLKTIYNYKWHWRHILHVIKDNPDNFFVVWTNAPLEPYSTNASQAALSKAFCTWAKDTLAVGLDPEFGAFPLNAYVFDFFSKLTGPNGMMLSQYAAGPGDSHPNAAATELVAPQFVEEIFDAAIHYEVIQGISEGSVNNGPALFSVHPNPCRESLTVCFKCEAKGKVSIALYDITGRFYSGLTDGYYVKGFHYDKYNVSAYPDGEYLLRWAIGSKVGSDKLIIRK